MYSSIKTYIQTYIKKDKQKDTHRKKDRKIAKEEGKEPVLGMPLVFQVDSVSFDDSSKGGFWFVCRLPRKEGNGGLT